MKFNRHISSDLRSPDSQEKARLVLGARQTGKSTLFELISEKGDILFDLQERSERLRLARDPAAFTRSLLPAGKSQQHVLVDEIQRVPQLLDEMQMLLDRYPGSFTFTITGSSARRLRRRDVNLLPGRIHRFSLGPVCLWEQEATGKSLLLPSPPRSEAIAPFPSRSLQSLLLLGSLPAAFVESTGKYTRTLSTYAETYIEEEVLREAAARNIGDYGRFLELAALESGKPLNYTKLSQESGIALNTIRGFYSVLEDTLVGFTIRPYSGSGRARILKTPRFYIFDVGVRNALARLPLDTGLLRLQAGHLLEHWVACELQVRIGYLGRNWRLSYWRTVDGAEVDFVLETPREAIPLKVKYTETPRPTHARSVEHFLDRYPDHARRGFVLCRTRRPEQLTRRVRALPWNRL
ncbi:MAG: hypothetical protein DRI34_00025 [Deltaproteobacteria bacterium]|nr:MAG: hypothetical protein DRI34_00025 [Deltaproteobacteria bacterium]